MYTLIFTTLLCSCVIPPFGTVSISCLILMLCFQISIILILVVFVKKKIKTGLLYKAVLISSSGEKCWYSVPVTTTPQNPTDLHGIICLEFQRER